MAEVLAVAFMGGIVAAANNTGLSLLLFPELAALSHDVLTRPRGKWTSQPMRMIATPTLTATAGLFITRHTHYGAAPVFLIVLASLAVLWLLRSSIGPAISAGVLPLALDERHWMYPVAICLGLVALAVLSRIWQRMGFAMDALSELEAPESVDEALEAPACDRFWMLHLLAFVLCLALTGQVNSDQLARLFTAANPGERVVFEFFLGTGLREGEVTYTTWKNINSNGGVESVRSKPEMGFRIKTRKNGLYRRLIL
jgi:hypothetical protein